MQRRARSAAQRMWDWRMPCMHAGLHLHNGPLRGQTFGSMHTSMSAHMPVQKAHTRKRTHTRTHMHSAAHQPPLFTPSPCRSK